MNQIINVHCLWTLLMDIVNGHKYVHRLCIWIKQHFISNKFSNLVICNIVYIRVNGHGHGHGHRQYIDTIFVNIKKVYNEARDILCRHKTYFILIILFFIYKIIQNRDILIETYYYRHTKREHTNNIHLTYKLNLFFGGLF